MFRSLAFRHKLILGSFLMVFTTLACMSAVVFFETRQGYLRQGREALRNVSRTLIETTALQDATIRAKIASDLKLMQVQFGLSGFPIPEIFMEVETELIGHDGARRKATLPGFKLGAVYLSENTGLVDRMRELGGVGASVLQLHEQELVRVSTNLAGQDGKRLAWTMLQHDGQAASAVRDKQQFSGLVKIMDQWFLAAYAPIFGMDNSELIGAMEVGRPLISPEFAGSAVNFNVGGKGWSFAFDASGRILLHPDRALVGRSLADFPWGQALLAAKDGPVNFTQDDEPREAWLADFAPWGVRFVTTVTRAELMQGINAQVLRSAGLSAAAALMVAALVIWIMIRQLMAPMLGLARLAEEVSRGNFDYSFDYRVRDAIGVTVQAVKAMVHEIKVRLGFSRGVLEGVVVPCAVVDLDDRLTHVNQSALDVLRRPGTPEAWLGRPLAALLFDTEARDTPTSRSMALRKHMEEEKTLDPQGDGREVILRLAATPIYDMDRELIGAMTLWVDLTLERAQHARLDEQNAMIAAAAATAREISQRLASSAHELAVQVSHSSDGASVQQGRISEVATAMDEMVSSVHEVTDKTSIAARLADDTMRVAEEGREVIHASIEVMRRVHAQVDALQSSMDQLGSQAEGIGKIMGVISDIADQTNLLALNAAIEAARAGDAGRGFAVVADEVRKLAEKTMAATREVGGNIRAIQDSTRSFIQSTGVVARSVGESDTLTSRSGQALEDILKRIESSAVEVQAIAAATAMQSQAGTRITSATEEVDRIARETADAMGQSAQAVGDLSQLASELGAVIERMAENARSA